MTRVVMHRLMDGRWRVTDAPDGWANDGRDFPEPKASDRVFDTSPTPYATTWNA